MNQTLLEVKRYSFGTAPFNKIIDAYYMAENDCFEIRLDNGTVYPLTNDELKKANKRFKEIYKEHKLKSIKEGVAYYWFLVGWRERLKVV